MQMTHSSIWGLSSGDHMTLADDRNIWGDLIQITLASVLISISLISLLKIILWYLYLTVLSSFQGTLQYSYEGSTHIQKKST